MKTIPGESLLRLTESMQTVIKCKCSYFKIFFIYVDIYIMFVVTEEGGYLYNTLYS